MKKVSSVLMTFLMIILSYQPVTDVRADYDTVKIYGADGSEYTIYESEAESFISAGYYTNISDVQKKLYAPDGREATVWLADVPLYTSLGWYTNQSDTIRTLYSPDGRETTVWLAEVPAYTSLGWFEDRNDVITVMAAPDGRKINVFNSQVQDYINVGWTPVQHSKINPAKPMLALTFDDGPRTASTGRILTALENYNARATFFVVGYLAAGNPQILGRMQASGCQIGNHTYSHPDLTTLSADNIASQLNRTANAIYNATGTYPTVIRPPYGSKNSTVVSVAQQPLILWSIDTLDWKHRNSDIVTNEVLTKAKDGDIVLMHDIYDTTASAAERIIPALIANGFQLVTVDELAMYKGKALNAHSSYSSIR